MPVAQGDPVASTFIRACGINQFLAGIRSDTNQSKSASSRRNPRCCVPGIPLETKNRVGELESPVISPVFGMTIAILRVTAGAETI
jgi:hypothetical protein